MAFPILYVVRHGETAWSKTGQHTGVSDIPLTPEGEAQAATLADRLGGLTFKAVFTSPLQRAHRTCELAGLAGSAQKDAALAEWDYGEYDGMTTAEIHKTRPDWNLFRDGCPGGETIEQVAARVDRFIAKVRGVGGDCVAFTSGHLSRVLCVRWLGLPPELGRCFLTGTASIGMLGYEHSLDEPVVRMWNVAAR